MVVFVDRGEDAEEGLTVAVVLEDCLLFVSPLNNMVHSSGVFDSQSPRNFGQKTLDLNL